MSIFDVIKETFFTNNFSEVFVYPPSKDPIRPEAYGYWSVLWSHDLSIIMIEQLKNNDKNFPLPCLGSFFSYLQVVSFYSAIHWVYAVNILRVPPRCVERMKVGLEDGVNSLTDPDSNPLSDDVKSYFKGSFWRYCDAIENDYLLSDDVDTSVIKPDLFEAPSIFIESISETHARDQDKITEIEKIYLKNIIGSLPPEILASMKERGLKYLL